MSDQVWWYATRAAGLMTWSTAIGSVIVGLLLSTRAIKSRTGPWLLDLHRFLAGLSVLFLVLHMVTLYFDSFVDFGVRELFIPGESSWNPEAAAWGIIAAYALVLVELTSLLRKHMSQSVWRTFHMLSIVTAIAGTYHAILGGSDVDNPLTWVVAGAGSAIVIGLVALRLHAAESPRPTGRPNRNSSDREALLMEMRDRLETLPVSADAPEPELETGGTTLPRRAPAEALASIRPEPAAPLGDALLAAPSQASSTPEPNQPLAFLDPSSDPEPVVAPAPNPFASDARNALLDGIVNPGPAVGGPAVADHAFAESPFDEGPFDEGPDKTEQVPPPAAAPFLTVDDLPTASPFDTPPAPTPEPIRPVPPAPAPLSSTPDPFASAGPTPDPFATPPAPADPFANPITAPETDPDPFADQPTPRSAGLFGPATDAEVAAEQQAADPFPELIPPAHDPFAPATGAATTSPSVSDPFASPPFASPDTPGTSFAPPVPPPVPEAADPVTGEPDEAAYTAWLVEWLAYAEKYGEEAPEDPSRVF